MDRQTVDRVIAALDAAAGVRMSGLVVSGPGGTVRHDFGGEERAADLRSISKVVVALAVGAGIAQGVQLRGRRLALDLEVAPFFADHIGRQPRRGRTHAAQLQLRHLLTNTLCHDEGFLFRTDLAGRDPGTLLDYAFSRELVHPPGTHFAYTNVGWYLISAMVTDALGVRLRDWAAQLVLTKLGITDVEWVRYGRYDAGGTGLRLSVTDLNRVGELILGDGVFRGRRIVPEVWVAAMRAPVVTATDDAPGPLRASAYGYGMWVCDSGIHYGTGTGGQYLVVAPGSGIVVAALAEVGDTRTVARCLAPLWAWDDRRQPQGSP